MNSCVTSKNVKWCHLIWSTLYMCVFKLWWWVCVCVCCKSRCRFRKAGWMTGSRWMCHVGCSSCLAGLLWCSGHALTASHRAYWGPTTTYFSQTRRWQQGNNQLKELAACGRHRIVDNTVSRCTELFVVMQLVPNYMLLNRATLLQPDCWH